MVLIAIFAVAQGLTYPLLSFILERQGVSSTLIGLNTAMTPLGLTLSAPLVPVLAIRYGSARIALVSVVALATLLALIGLFQDASIWLLLRFLLGFSINGLYVTSETWINILAPKQIRGRILGFFSACLAAGFAIGPFIIVLVGSRGWPPFLVGIAMVALSGLLLLFVMNRLPAFDQTEKSSVRSFLPLAPYLLLVIVIAAAFDQGTLALLPIYGLGYGWDEATMATAIGIFTIGNILFQAPIGWFADIWSRRGVMAVLCVLTVAGAVCLPWAIHHLWLLMPLLFVWGSAALGVYTIALVELGDRFTGAVLLSGNAAFAAMWGIGGMIGPPVFGGAMDSIGLNGLPLMLGMSYLVLALITLSRRSPPETD